MQIIEKSENTTTPVIPTSFFIPKTLHSRVKTIAGLKRVKMADIFIEGIRMALDSDRYRLSDEERQDLFPV